MLAWRKGKSLNMISCSLSCKYQNEGSCTLDGASRLAGSNNRACPYCLEEGQASKKVLEHGGLDGLGKAGDSYQVDVGAACD